MSLCPRIASLLNLVSDCLGNQHLSSTGSDGLTNFQEELICLSPLHISNKSFNSKSSPHIQLTQQLKGYPIADITERKNLITEGRK